MIRCEDYPCCGHDMNDCPDPNRDTDTYFPFDCVECWGPILRGEEMPGAESMHASCARNYRGDPNEPGFDPGPDMDDR